MMREPIRIGIIGTDTSHAVLFTRFINDINHQHHVQGGKVIAAFPGGSPDFPLSASRVDGFMETIENEYGVERGVSPEAVASQCDALLLLSADGRVHMEQFHKLAPFRKPVFIDKPFALSVDEAISIFKLANHWDVPVMSSSSLRYAEPIVRDLDLHGRHHITTADVQGPLVIEPTQSHYFWYGLHSVEMLYAIMGPGCRQVQVVAEPSGERLIGLWSDGRQGTALCISEGDSRFMAHIHRGATISTLDAESGATPYYASLIAQVMHFFQTGQSLVHWRETVEIIAFLEAAEKSRATGGSVQPLSFLL
ncbi:gfo/Idh/MocA family oxidoreductase [Paenibacillus sp. 1011MAR3C5]|uniref:Gfo/Idh/MocA family oxidoreductase n=1 Tax=Paenibacillus sp. 1011MAR3C5 TaxID=1675787 RepID=UPI000E6C45AF|nr:Gfo/Idh/MocA family oxidoreductase [Paenibacillus sp. 1011MAR3C5]RJE90325.1 gfo/Idh/MocA family oxidoreductase [Paenibacillus sp. 1011MAR3C5]